MKIFCIVLLAVSGLAVNASPTCSDFDIEKKCSTFQPSEGETGMPDTEEKLDKMCKTHQPILECLIKEAERCPDTVNGKYLDTYLLNKEIGEALCTKGNELRTKYLEHVKCFAKELNTVGEECNKLLPLLEPCEMAYAEFGCAYSKLVDRCGNDAADVAYQVAKPSFIMQKKRCIKEQDHDFDPFGSSYSFPFTF